jgi:hypothetical protein
MHFGPHPQHELSEDRGRIRAAMQQCAEPESSTDIFLPAMRGGRGSVDRTKTLAKVLRERDAEIVTRAFGYPSSPLRNPGQQMRTRLCKGIGQSGDQ